MPDDPALLTAAWFDAWRTKDAGAIERMFAWRVRYEQASRLGEGGHRQ